MTACFAETYQDATQARLAEGLLVAGGPFELGAHLRRCARHQGGRVANMVDGDVVWSEWEMAGTRRDGAPHIIRGVIIFGIAEGRASWARFYLEPVDTDDESATAGVERVLADRSGRPT